jgi:hypothetical protein
MQQDGLFPQEDNKKKKDSDKKKKSKGFESVGTLFSKYKVKEKPGYISKEFQDFGYRLALELDDMSHKSLYMRMAKRENRAILERALSFVSDSTAKSKARLFMWKVKQLKEEKKEKDE